MIFADGHHQISQPLVSYNHPILLPRSLKTVYFFVSVVGGSKTSFNWSSIFVGFVVTPKWQGESTEHFTVGFF